MIASLFLTPASGGASPHFDKNENFTIQLTGGKRWVVGETPMVSAPPDGYILGQHVPSSLAALLKDAREPPAITVDLIPGSLLYVPRGTVHRTGSGILSWSLNLSYSPAMWSDLIRVGLKRRLAGSQHWREIVTGVGGASDESARKVSLLPALAAELRGMLDDPAELDRIAREFLDHPDD